MTESPFEIGGAVPDAARIVEEIQRTVEARRRAGAYADPRLMLAEQANLLHRSRDANFLDLYLAGLKDAVFVDINDFDIRERRRYLAPWLVRLKKGLWNLLKFYTYRLWSQQNEVNGLLLTAIEEMDRTYRARIEALERQVGLREAASSEPRDAAPPPQASNR